MSARRMGGSDPERTRRRPGRDVRRGAVANGIVATPQAPPIPIAMSPGAACPPAENSATNNAVTLTPAAVHVANAMVCERLRRKRYEAYDVVGNGCMKRVD